MEKRRKKVDKDSEIKSSYNESEQFLEKEVTLEELIVTAINTFETYYKEFISTKDRSEHKEIRKKWFPKINKEWNTIIQCPDFNEEMFLKYQNYIGINPENINDYLKNHILSDEFLETFFKSKKWYIPPYYVFKYQPHAHKFMEKYKAYFDEETYNKYLESLKNTEENNNENNKI